MNNTLQNIKYNYAKGAGFKSFKQMIEQDGIDEFDLDIISKEYATQSIINSLKKASENAKLKFENHYNYVDKESITNPENIILL